MSGIQSAELHRRWFPVCGVHDLPPWHLFETELLGEELVIWRGADGGANVWKNRCPHRGVRLTVGAHLGRELRCAYHGYRFATGTGRCTSVPAQPEKSPPQSLCVKIYPVVERDGLVWTRLAIAGEPREFISGPCDGTGLYPMVVKAPALTVGVLLADYRFRPSAALANPEHPSERCVTSRMDAYRFRSAATLNEAVTAVNLSLQPVDAECSVIHGVLLGHLPESQRVPTLAHHARRMSVLRDACELRP